jgi:hypothetical protein
MTHHAGPPAHETEKPPLTTGRLAVWLTFWLFLAIMVLGTVVSLTGKGAQ